MLLSEKLINFKQTLKMGVIADRAGISRSVLSKYANRGSMPPADAALRIARALGVSVEWLIDDEQDWPPVWDRRKHNPDHTVAQDAA